MLGSSWRPRVVCYAEYCDESMTYFAPHDQVVIEGHVSLQRALLHLCTGHNSATEIASSLSGAYDNAEVLQLLEVLRQQCVVVDSRNCWKAYHAFGSNPMPFFSSPSDEELQSLYRTQSNCQVMECQSNGLLELIRRRVSNRDFTNKPISHDAMLRIVCAGYGIADTIHVMGISVGRRTVPSAGALYPLSIHVVVCRSSIDGDCGTYVFDGAQLSKITKLFEDASWQKCFLEDTYVQTHSVCFVVSGNIQRQTTKYADRGYRYAILEAGHVAQNMLLACTEMENIGCVEVGGFFDEELANFLSLPTSSVPITTVFVGSLG